MVNQSFKLNACNANYETQLAVQGEINSRVLSITLIDKVGVERYVSNAESIDRPVNLTGATAMLFVTKPDGKTAETDGTIADAENGKVDFILPEQATTVAGKADCQILIFMPDDSKLKVTGLTLQIQPSEVEAAAESSDEFLSLVVALNKVNPAVERIDKAVSDSETALKNANKAKDSANTAANNANEKAELANTAANNANEKANLADEKAGLAGEKANLASKAADDANKKAELANAAANLANEKAGLANTAATNANNKANLADTAANSANTATIRADTAANLANDKATLAETATTSTNEAKDDCIAATNNAKTATTAANTATGKANTAADRANTAAENAESAIAGQLDPAIDARIKAKTDVEGGIASCKALNAKSDKSILLDCNLLATKWIGTEAPYTYKVENEKITAVSNQELLPSDKITAKELLALQSANLTDIGQDNGYFMLQANGVKPSIDIPIRLIFRGDM